MPPWSRGDAHYGRDAVRLNMALRVKAPEGSFHRHLLPWLAAGAAARCYRLAAGLLSSTTAATAPASAGPGELRRRLRLGGRHLHNPGSKCARKPGAEQNS